MKRIFVYVLFIAIFGCASGRGKNAPQLDTSNTALLKSTEKMEKMKLRVLPASNASALVDDVECENIFWQAATVGTNPQNVRNCPLKNLGVALQVLLSAKNVSGEVHLGAVSVLANPQLIAPAVTAEDGEKIQEEMMKILAERSTAKERLNFVKKMLSVSSGSMEQMKRLLSDKERLQDAAAGRTPKKVTREERR